MKRYYRTVMELGQLNEMLLQLFQEKILYADEPAQITPIRSGRSGRLGFCDITENCAIIQFLDHGLGVLLGFQ